eukprot:CAMPEP_0172027094 /NCGR_PEP_ID=MMETSP1041-20130122/16813_1 /TAXON_ID=464988 /ORGANISM="Hemiselmis andersenii, Strain CCMP439" /LENGTH=79 /DNA_ID=CAMNT_0012682965 /DNA_START=249 /DNA_END=485 /DNA_ORIENTATION=-
MHRLLGYDRFSQMDADGSGMVEAWEIEMTAGGDPCDFEPFSVVAVGRKKTKLSVREGVPWATSARTCTRLLQAGWYYPR